MIASHPSYDHEYYFITKFSASQLHDRVVLPGNGDQHAVEIASMSLDLLNKTAAFVIPHIPARRVQLRIGIHTGT